MKILKIRFANLNSLTGNWEIDLTDSAFLSNGIFAITGPTGAGKSTILDAICLALYGRTPRLNKITKSNNEIMSRQTGECFTEITFETPDGVFRCHWSQHRARKKPDGELQAPKHEIADALTGKIIETKLRDVAGQIESITGMDFDQFTRSMLLAQGGFAAFLQADPDQRAPILEQITGTDIYSRISIRVHEIRSEEQKKLELLEKELSGLMLLSKEDEHTLQFSLEQKQKEEVSLYNQIKNKNTAIQWLDKVSNLKKELENLQQQKKNLHIRLEQFKPQKLKLDRAQKALEISAEYTRLNLLRNAQKTDTENCNKMVEAVPEHYLKVKEAEKKFENSLQNLEEVKNKLKEELKIIQKVRELDLKIGEKKNPINNLKEKLALQSQSLSELEKEKNRNDNFLNQNRLSLEKISRSLEKTTPDETLVENLAGINTRLDNFIEIDSQYKQTDIEISKAENQKNSCIEKWNQKKETLEKKQKEIEKLKNTLNQKQEEHKAILEKKDVTDWRNELSNLNKKKLLLEKIKQSFQAINHYKLTLKELSENNEKLASTKQIISERIITHNEKVSLLDQQKQHLETNLNLLNQIASFKEARKKLTHGKQCPLCGSREHPFAKDNIPTPDKTETELKKVNDLLKQTQFELSNLLINQTEVSKDLDQNNRQKKECSDKLEKDQNQIFDWCKDLETFCCDSVSQDNINRIYEENETNIEHISRIVDLSDDYEKNIGKIRDTLEKKRDKLSEIEREGSEAFHEKESSIQTLQRLKTDSSALNVKLKQIHEKLLSEISPLGIKELSSRNIKTIRQELSLRRKNRLDWQKEKSDLEKSISTLKLQIENQSQQIQNSSSEIQKLKQELSKHKQEKENLTNERKKLYGYKNPDEEQNSLEKSVRKAEKYYEETGQILNKTTAELEMLKTSIRDLEKAISNRKLQLNSAEDQFKTCLEKSGFNNENTYICAVLSENDRNRLTETARTLETEHTSLETRIQDKSLMLENENKKEITSDSLEKLTSDMQTLSTQLKTIQQEIGGITQRLKDNDNAQKQQKDKMKVIEMQKKQCFRWNMLHELIGSADGKKYRNFAQGLTFEIMIKYANQQLNKMTDRYILIRDRKEPLELNVVDTYQAGEIRSTRNLSGGESFIVSLSLALGLSSMASNNVRVDSLFLDEGFGSLDEDALDTALETLGGLHQSGKLIGIISHVTILKERVGTMIQINPIAGGRSEITGPGCRKI